MRRRLTYRQLEAFVAVLETGSVTRAAERLHISQPALSQLISNFESDLGYPMFRRSGGRLAPTAEAELLRDEVQSALAAVERACRRAQDIGSFRAGRLAISAFPAFAATALPRLLAPFCEEHPGVRVTLNATGSSAQMAEEVSLQRVDFALSDFPGRANGVIAEHLRRYHAVCVVQLTHAFAGRKVLPLAEVGKEQLVCVREEDEARALALQGFHAAGVDVQWNKEVSLSASACAWVAAAGGVAIVDPLVSEDWRGRLLSIHTSPPIIFDLWLLRSETRPLTRIASAFLERVWKYLNTLPGSPSPSRKRQRGKSPASSAERTRSRKRPVGGL
jgi:DNA-binding transcriptional LysR family regulator